LQFPHSVIVPPVACIKVGPKASEEFPELVQTQPLVASTYTKVMVAPFVLQTKFSAEPSILDPFLKIVKLFVPQLFA
jgi:hypothetical protein